MALKLTKPEPAPETESTVVEAWPPPPADAPTDPYRWQPMADAPKNRAIYLTADAAAADPDAVLCYWRHTRTRTKLREWQKIEYWACVLNNRRAEFEPAAWREASAPAALQGAFDAAAAKDRAEAFRARQADESERDAGVAA